MTYDWIPQCVLGGFPGAIGASSRPRSQKTEPTKLVMLRTHFKFSLTKCCISSTSCITITACAIRRGINAIARQRRDYA